jgi:hypothetical protein
MRTSLVVLIPCLLTLIWGVFVVSETLIWKISEYYPSFLARVRYVNDIQRLTPQAIADICHLPLTQAELQEKQNVLLLRCGTPGVEGVYRIEIWRE